MDQAESNPIDFAGSALHIAPEGLFILAYAELDSKTTSSMPSNLTSCPMRLQKVLEDRSTTDLKRLRSVSQVWKAFRMW
jgi:hypothetical protein